MLGKLLDRILHDEEDLEIKVKQKKDISFEENRGLGKKDLLIALFVFLLALGVRLYSLFYITDPQNAGVEGWYSDTYHHWQIAYLTKEIGLKEGFLRLWDLKGMEYFWGAGHPLVGALLIAITGSTSIVNFRILSAIMGSGAVALIFLIVKRHWTLQAALAAAFLGAFNPVGIFSDASGMVEPLGFASILAGIYFFPKRAIISGLFLAAASMTRAEYWLLSLLILVGMLLTKSPSNKKPTLIVAYLIPIILYMKYLLDYTGNPIYPIWWNFIGNAFGEWQADIAPTIEQLDIQKVYWLIALFSIIGILATLWRRPKVTPLYLFGLGNWLMWGVFIGMTKYLLSYLPRFWVDRIMTWPYLFLAVAISILIFGLVPQKLHKSIKIILSVSGWILIGLILFISQIAWKEIHRYYDPTRKNWENFRQLSSSISKYDTREGKILLPEYWPPLTYTLVHFEGIKGERIVGQMFDPFFYMEGDPFANWGENREIIFNWLESENIKLMIIPEKREDYIKLVSREENAFEKIGELSRWSLLVYQVKD